MALKRKLQIILDSVAPEIHNLWLRPIDDLRWELNFFNGNIWRPLDITYFRIEDRNKLDYVFEFVDTLTPDHFGLGEVDNTSDLNKPISIATQAALNHKLNTPSPGRKETGVDAGVFGELSIDGEFLYFCTQSGNSSTAVWVPLQSAEDIATALSEAISDHQHSVEDITDIGDIATINKSGGTTQFLRGDGTWQSPPVTTVNGYTGGVTITPTDLGLEEVENKNVETILSELTFSNVTTALGFTPLNSVLKGAVNGLAELNESGVIPASQLPSFVDDVIEYDSLDLFPQEGTTGKIYVAKNTNLTYRWSGTGYINLDTSLALGITAETAYRGDYGNTAYSHSQVVDGTNPHQITFSNLVNKPTTISGYGITDSLVYTDDSRLSDARNANDVYTWAKEENKPSYTYDEVGAAPTTHDHVVGDITNFPTSLPASDVSSWAKAENKPSYTFSEIGSHPTTLSGYGITDATPSSHIGATGNAHGIATSEINGFMSTDDKVKLTNIAENANNYSHPTGDGNLHVPETGTTNNGKVLKAGGTAGSISWENDIDTITSINGKTGVITKEDITALGIPAQDTVYIHPDSHPATIITQTSDYRFVTDTEKGVWNGKEDISNKKTDLTADSDTYYPSQKAVKTAINAIQVGGRNLWTNSRTIPYTVTIFQHGYSSGSKNISELGLKTGELITFSVYVSNIPAGESVYARIDFYRPDNSYVPQNTQYSISNEGVAYISTFVRDTSEFDRISYRVMPVNYTADYQVNVVREKLERGNKATDWTPAPEDKEDVINKKTTINSSDTEYPTSKAVDTALRLKVDKTSIVNNLTTTTEGSVLDARQGKVLNDILTTVTGDISDLQNQIAWSLDGLYPDVPINRVTIKRFSGQLSPLYVYEDNTSLMDEILSLCKPVLLNRNSLVDTYLSGSNCLKSADGYPANLTAWDKPAMTLIGGFWMKYEYDASTDTKYFKFSPYKVVGYKYVRRRYVGMFNGNTVTNSLDGESKTFLCSNYDVYTTQNITLQNAHSYAKNLGTYFRAMADQDLDVYALLFSLFKGTVHTQGVYEGITNVNGTNWAAYNKSAGGGQSSYGQFHKNGATMGLTSHEGEVSLSVTDFPNGAITVKPNRFLWRENSLAEPYLLFTSGRLIIDNVVWQVNDLADIAFTKTENFVQLCSLAGIAPPTTGWQSILETHEDTLMPSAIGGSATTGMCDQWYGLAAPAAGGVYVPSRLGSATIGSRCGLRFLISESGPSNASATYGVSLASDDPTDTIEDGTIAS